MHAPHHRKRKHRTQGTVSFKMAQRKHKFKANKAAPLKIQATPDITAPMILADAHPRAHKKITSGRQLTIWFVAAWE